MKKEQLVELLEQINKASHFRYGEKFKASFRSVTLNSDYFVPSIFFSTKSALASRKVEYALFCEIEVNGICTFREYTIINDNSDLQKIEDETMNKLAISILLFALSNSYNIIKDRHEKFK